MEKYELDIISNHVDFNNKILKKYNIEGVDTVGAFGNEPFSIRFKNNTNRKVQIKVSLDGTDILTGKEANTDINNQMWVVNGFQTVELSAFPETNNGGASFVFTHAENSVAKHTHGNISHQGIIAIAIYEEQEIARVNIKTSRDYLTYGEGILRNGTGRFDLSQERTICSNNVSPAGYVPCSNKSEANVKNLSHKVAVGAGNYVDQKIDYVEGLIKPSFAQILKIRYLWWSDLENKLKTAYHLSDSHPSGFPGDKEHKIIDLKNTPKLNTTQEIRYTGLELNRVQ